MGFENGKLLRVSMQAVHANGQQHVNTMHYDCVDGIAGNAANDPQSLADFFRDNVVGPFKAMYTNGWTIKPVVVVQEKDPQNPTAARSEWTSGADVAGTRTSSGDDVAFAICAVAGLRTAHIGRRFRGRLFLGGSVQEGDINGELFNGSINGLRDAFVAAIPRQPDIASGVSTSVCNWVVYSRTQRAQDVDPYANAIVSVTNDRHVHWLRSRQYNR